MSLNLNHVDLNLLIVLEALFEERSVSKAAVRLGRSQPAISVALHRLRLLFNDELLVRVGQRYELTAAAQALAEPLHPILQQLSDVLTARPIFDPQRADREFRVGASDYTAAVLLRPVIRKLAVTAPKIRISIEPTGDDPGAPLRNGQEDLAFYPIELRPKRPDLCFETVLRDDLCCVAWSRNRSIGHRLTREKFESLPHIVDLHGTSPEQSTIGRLLAAAGSHREHIVRTNYILLMPFLLEGTQGLAVLPRRLADWLSRAAALRVFPLPFDPPQWVLGMCWNSRFTDDPAHLWLRTLVKETARSLPRSQRRPSTSGPSRISRKRVRG
jgi:LysR family transcriptional regulator, nod-box dependent transcriptional activator